MVNKVYLVTPRGFCAGVEMAIKALHWLLKFMMKLYIVTMKLFITNGSLTNFKIKM